MANEITGTFSFSFFKSSVMNAADGLAVANFIQSWSGSVYSKGVIAVSNVTPTAIPLGEVSSPGAFVLLNLDAVNYCSIQNGSGGAEFLRLIQNDCVFGRLGPAVVPYAIANSAGIALQYLILSP